jgi:hypothetical protein
VHAVLVAAQDRDPRLLRQTAISHSFAVTAPTLPSLKNNARNNAEAARGAHKSPTSPRLRRQQQEF